MGLNLDEILIYIKWSYKYITTVFEADFCRFTVDQLTFLSKFGKLSKDGIGVLHDPKWGFKY